MHFERLLNRVFAHKAVGVDKRVHRTLLGAAKTLCECKHLSIAGLGRHFRSKAGVKHVIKRMDRLFGNAHLHHKREPYYREMARLLVGAQGRPVILVDWSGLTRCGEYHFLRASIAVGGRALVIWESTYTEKEYSSAKAHREFVLTLKRLLPDECRAIIVTDAGFRNPWFELIRHVGWDYIGRVRNNTYCLEAGQNEWARVKSHYGKATRVARYLFSGMLAKSNPMAGHFTLYRGLRKQRKSKNLRGHVRQNSVSLKQAKRESEPWLLFSSLPPESASPKYLVQLYRARMQIEEAFRDLKVVCRPVCKIA